ncbi:hypothetical protein F4778DRAFT_801825 [Xylariomycetidae sp. FL2044]|nr:hypothetical protein F4778DRAFT_801825 [Xylariomycetidae sp. FL2044]
MAERTPQATSPAAAGRTPHLPRRRKIRKGTQSCWECKRRKIRCTFVAPTEAICDGCRSRRVHCVSQEFHDEQQPSAARRTSNRLDRMESAVAQLVSRNHGNARDALDHVEEAGPLQVSRVNASSTIISNPPRVGLHIQTQGVCHAEETTIALLKALPRKQDFDIIFSASAVSVSILFQGIVCIPYSRYVSTQLLLPPERILKLPPPGSHPVLTARALLLLGLLLQGVAWSAAQKLASLGLDHRAVMERAVNAASKLVNNDNELVTSIEGVECLMMESLYWNHAGHLRRAWLKNRRAMSLAQMMGLHAGEWPPSSMVLEEEEEARRRIEPEYMWFRLVCTDRYLSSMLGLPQGWIDSAAFASAEALERCGGVVERIERIETVACGFILQRNHGTERTSDDDDDDDDNFAATHKVDRMLRDTSALMPPRWWASPIDLAALAGGGKAAKITAATASRSSLAQFVAFRGTSGGAGQGNYCRGIDFVAFIASTSMCLAHIQAQAAGRGGGACGLVTALHSLRHQRLGDRALLERTLEIMQTMARADGGDAIAQRISDILAPLLAVEDNAAAGATYDTSASPAVEERDTPCLVGSTGAAAAGLPGRIWSLIIWADVR